MLRLLARAFDVTALCFERSATAGGGARWEVVKSADALGRFANVEVFAIPQRHSRVRWAWDHLRSSARAKVYTHYLYGSRPFERRLIELLRSQPFDLVHVDSLDLSRYLPRCMRLPIVCVHHDIESVLLRRRARIDQQSWRRAYLRYQSRLMTRVERHWCSRVTLNVVCSEDDAGRLQEMVPNARVAVVPNGVDVDEFQSGAEAGHGLAFVGGTNPFPNHDALDFFCEQVRPHIQAVAGELTMRWIGRASAEQQRDYQARYGVELTGYVDDVRPLMREARCHVVPLRMGGGTRLKILNSWAMGKPVVSTSVGCEGLAAIDGDNILIRDHPRDFADAVRAVLDDGALRRRLGQGGRATVERRYSWDVIGDEMLGTYLDLVPSQANQRMPVASIQDYSRV